ncbi:MAG: hypothetical protein KDB96_18110, partial [Flavobacteriales bacterium]|nr:hypothetical protein [Flavobacteriales bacterium]
IHQAVKLPPGTSAPLLPNTLPSYLPVANSATVWHERPPSLGLYPNPASDQVQVTLPPVLSPVTSFELRDATGRSLAQGRLVVR